jgi:NIPSNAP
MLPSHPAGALLLTNPNQIRYPENHHLSKLDRTETFMQRRRFLAAALVTSAAAIAPQTIAQAQTARPREFYLLRRYHLQTGPQTQLTENYFASALIPALTRLGLGPVGAFRLDFGPETPTFYLLIPGSSLDLLAQLDAHLQQDAEFLQLAAPFWNAPATAPAFLRVESSLHVAFEGWPKLVLPPATALHAKRVFQLRVYESPSNQDHIRKIEMFHRGEFDFFKNAGFHSVFFSDTLIGPRLPNLTYMLSSASAQDLDNEWAAFVSDPAWIKLRSSPRYAFEEIVSNVSNLILSPLSASQI